MGNTGSSVGAAKTNVGSTKCSSCNGCSQGGNYFSFGKVTRRKSPVRRRKSPVRRRKSPVRRRKSPVRRRKNPVRRRKNPVRRRKSPVRRRKSPVRRRKSPVKRRKSPVRKSKTLKFGSCNSCSHGGNYFSFGKSNMTHLNIPTNRNISTTSNVRQAKMSMVAKPALINTVPHMHFGRLCFGS